MVIERNERRLRRKSFLGGSHYWPQVVYCAIKASVCCCRAAGAGSWPYGGRPHCLLHETTLAASFVLFVWLRGQMVVYVGCGYVAWPNLGQIARCRYRCIASVAGRSTVTFNKSAENGLAWRSLKRCFLDSDYGLISAAADRRLSRDRNWLIFLHTLHRWLRRAVLVTCSEQLVVKVQRLLLLDGKCGCVCGLSNTPLVSLDFLLCLGGALTTSPENYAILFSTLRAHLHPVQPLAPPMKWLAVPKPRPRPALSRLNTTTKSSNWDVKQVRIADNRTAVKFSSVL